MFKNTELTLSWEDVAAAVEEYLNARLKVPVTAAKKAFGATGLVVTLTAKEVEQVAFNYVPGATPFPSGVGGIVAGPVKKNAWGEEG